MKKFLIYIFAVLAVACKIDTPSNEHNSSEIGVVSFASTKGSGSKETYRVYLNGIENTVTQGIETSGTYYDIADGEPLQPCLVDGNGAFVSLDDSKGLRSINGTYKIYIVSPAVAMTPIPYTGYESLQGYRVLRNMANNQEPLYVSQTADVTLNGVYLSNLNGSQHTIYDASDYTLKQPRSKIRIRFACGNNIQSTTLQKVTISNIIEEGYFRPVEYRYYFEQQYIADYIIDKSVLPDLLPLTLENPNYPNGNNPNPPTDLGIEQYILSMDYGEKDSQGNTKWPLPSFIIETGDSEQEVVKFTAALGWNFEPQHTYEFTITINSIYANITVTVLPWDDKGNENTSVENPKKWSIDFPITDGEQTLLDWEVVDDINGSID